MVRRSLVIPLLCALAAPILGQPRPADRLGTLLSLAPMARQRAMDRLWDSLFREGGPLVQYSPEQPDSATVTFLWKGQPTTHRVVVIMPSTLHNFESSIMQRVPDTPYWYRSLSMPAATRIAYRFEVDGPATPLDQDPQVFRRLRGWQQDPTNSERFVYATQDTASVLALRDSPTAVWSRATPGVARGSVWDTTLSSRALGGQRTVWVYRPRGRPAPSRGYPVLVVTDGQTHLRDLRIDRTLDNLIAAESLPPLIAVGVTGPNRGSDLGCNPAYGDFIVHELLPWLASHEDIAVEARAVAITGYSLGGLASACAALHHPDRISMVLAQSGSFWRSIPEAGPSEGVARALARGPRLPLRFYLEVGQEEIGPMFGGDPSTLTANRHLRDILIAKGYAVTYAERASGHEPVAWREDLPQGLLALFGPAVRETPRP